MLHLSISTLAVSKLPHGKEDVDKLEKKNFWGGQVELLLFDIWRFAMKKGIVPKIIV
jgi:hypothetical protein